MKYNLQIQIPYIKMRFLNTEYIQILESVLQ